MGTMRGRWMLNGPHGEKGREHCVLRDRIDMIAYSMTVEIEMNGERHDATLGRICRTA